MNKFNLLLLFIIGSVTSYAQTGNIIIPSGHSKGVKQVILDKQGKYLYMLEDGQVIMWDAKTHDQLYTFKNNFDDMALSNDGTKLLVGTICYSTITGKELFKVKSDPNVFSADDKTIYGTNGDLISTDVQTQKKTMLMPRINMGWKPKIFVLDDKHLLIAGEFNGWSIFNLTNKNVDFTSNAGGTYMPNLQCMAVGLKFLDIFTGKLLKSFPNKEGKPVIIPSADDKTFIYKTGDYIDTAYHVVNGENWTVVKQFKVYSYLGGGYYSGKQNLIYKQQLYNVKTGLITNAFKGQTANLGSFEYNYNSGIVNIVTDESFYKSIDMVKMKPFRHTPISDMQMIAYSPTGDTTAIFNWSKETVTIKNMITGKLLLPPITLTNEVASSESGHFFFDKNGTHIYYALHNIKKQVMEFNRITVKTGLKEHIFDFRGARNTYLHPDRDLLAAFESGYQYTHARVWDVKTGKILFDKDVDKEHYDYIALSDDKKRVLLVLNKAPQIYDLATGNLISQGKVSLLSDVFGNTPDLSIIANGTIYGDIRAINTAGEVLYDIKAHIGAIYGIEFSQDGKIMYTKSDDQTIKVWQAKTGKLYGTLYLFKDGNDYVFLDAYGRFDGTEGGMKRMYYFRDRIKISLDVVYEKFYTPNLYQRLINGEQFEPIDIIINPQPLVKINYAQITRNLNVVDDKTPSYQNTTSVAEITVNAIAENDKVDEIRLFHNGKIVNLATRGLFVTDNTSGNETKKYTINLLPGMNSIRAVALNSQRTESKPDEILVNYSAVANNNPVVTNPVSNNNTVVSTVSKDATLHLIVVGINEYQNKSMSLNYAIADATAFKEEVEKDAKTILGTVKTYFVTNNTADKAGITSAFKEVQQNAKPQDVFIFYYAGHGVIGKDKEFYLVPTDVSDLKNVQTELEQKGIASKLLQQYAIDIPAQKQLFILDACQSAGAFEKLLSNSGEQQKSLAVVARSTGTHWMAASGAMQFANEFSSLGHGAFTYVLLQALKGEAASNKMITVNGLKNFLQTGVPALMKKYNGSEQYPASYGFGNDFPVEVIK